MKKRLIAILLILSLVLTVFPMAAFAEEPACKHEHTAPYSESFGNTRGEFFLMLWKMYGCPEPRIEDKFEDVSEADVFYKAVLWATQNNISNGLTDTQFRPEQAATRAQAVTFLWRAAGCPEPENPYTTFRDLKSGAFYEKAVAWAAEQDWLELRTDGVSFRPDYSAGEFHLEGTVCEDCGAILETTKLSFSEPVLASGTFGDNLKWKITGQTLTITGSGEMMNLDEYQEAPWYEYWDIISHVNLPEGLLSIGDGAFSGCCYLADPVIPGSVRTIGEGAFYNCSAIMKLTIPEGVTSIADGAFYSCHLLGEVSIPDSVSRIGYKVFGDTDLANNDRNWTGGLLYFDDWVVGAYEDIKTAQIKAGTKGLCDALFYECQDLTSVSVPDSVTYIGEGAFYDCVNLKSVKIPNGVTRINQWTYGFCEELTSIEIPESVEFVGEYAFYGCESLKSVTIANKECVIEEGDEEPEYMLGIPGQTTIYGYADSTAQAYADKYGYRFVELSEKVPFIDVPAKAFYVDPVAWAVENDITKGVDDTHFGSDKACTRGQVVTFLWRAAGCPEPKSTETGFKDMKPGAFYEKAVAWAVEEGITKGLSDTAFGPDATCTRGQIVTFLYRAADRQGEIYDCLPFGDVRPEDYFFPAVGWAVANGVTNGMTENTFGPNEICTRGQVVTFLYRAAAE